MKMKKIIKGVAIAAFVLLLAFAVGYVSVHFWYYPHYRDSQEAYSPANVSKDGEIRVMTSNIRYFNLNDIGKRSWFYRANLLIDGIEKEYPDIIGFQEVTTWQYEYLDEVFEGYTSVITYRDEATNTEGCPVFFREDRFDLVNKGSFWLSETPEVMSRDWDAGCYRICSYVVLIDKTTGKEFAVFNTHLDHMSDLARINGINVVLDKIKEMGSLPSVLMGDFNASEDSETYRMATESFYDAKYLTPNPDSGCTFQDFGRVLDWGCIDYVMVSKEGIGVNSVETLRDTYDGVYSSDHFPITASIYLK